ncbi:MAG: hypothetical protein FJ253_04200 [Phycisphaerae bacterium]|nr:hypothetical protein [Phycisphaerae bacterium]
MTLARFTSALAVAALAVGSASAEILPPGSSTALTGWVPAAGGTEIHSASYSFASTNVPVGGIVSTGTLDQTVKQQLSGELLFSLRISQLSTGPNTHLVGIMIGEWAGFSVDTDFLLGSGISDPGMAARSAGIGDVVSWSDFSGPMSDGKNTSWMQILTDAAGFTIDMSHIRLDFSDGSMAQFRIAAPSTIPAPGALALLLGAALGGLRRRR